MIKFLLTAGVLLFPPVVYMTTPEELSVWQELALSIPFIVLTLILAITQPIIAVLHKED